MKLKKLIIDNFKGIDYITVEFSDHTIIKGANGTGKTSLLDAWMWLIAGTDSFGRTKFNYRPAGCEEDISVGAVMDVDGTEIVISRKQTANGKGNTNSYCIDGFEVKEKEYKEKLSDLLDSELFKALSIPTAFCELHWTKQREILMRLADDVNDAELADKELLPLLEKASPDAIKKKFDKQAKDLKKELAEIPIRIDEDEHMCPEHMDLRINTLRERQREIAQQIADCEKVLYQLDQYTIKKCEAVEDSINSKFPKGMYFILYTEDYKPCCEVVVNGVYHSTLSTGQKITTGLEICKVLFKHFDVRFPVWVDNAESLSKKINVVDGQLVELRVSRNRKLKIER